MWSYIMNEKKISDLFEINSKSFFGIDMKVDEVKKFDSGLQNLAFRVRSGDHEYVVKVFSKTKYPDDQSLNELDKNEIFAHSLKEKGCTAVCAMINKSNGSRLILHDDLRCMIYPYINGQKVDEIENNEHLIALTLELSKIVKHSIKIQNGIPRIYDFSKFDELKSNFIKSNVSNLQESNFHFAEKFINYYKPRSVEQIFTHVDINQYNCIFTINSNGKVQANIIDWEDCSQTQKFKFFLAYALEASDLWNDDIIGINFDKFKIICETFFKENYLNMEEFEHAFNSCGVSFVNWLQKNLKIALESEEEFERERSVQTCIDVVPVFEKMEKIRAQTRLIISRSIENNSPLLAI